jgi:hypothetical protein
MAIYTVSRPDKERTDREYGFVMVKGTKHKVFRTSPLFGDLGYGAVTVNGETYSVYRAKKEDGDKGYGVIDVKKRAEKKPLRFHTTKLPDELAEIVSIWSDLPEDIKAKVESLVKNNKKE